MLTETLTFINHRERGGGEFGKNSQRRLLLNILIVLLWKRSECSLKEISLYWAKQKLCSVWDAGTADESSKQACGADATFKEKCISSIRLWRYKVMKTFSLLENERHVLAKRQSKLQILHMIFCLTKSCWNPIVLFWFHYDRVEIRHAATSSCF